MTDFDVYSYNGHLLIPKAIAKISWCIKRNDHESARKVFKDLLVMYGTQEQELTRLALQTGMKEVHVKLSVLCYLAIRGRKSGMEVLIQEITSRFDEMLVLTYRSFFEKGEGGRVDFILEGLPRVQTAQGPALWNGYDWEHRGY